MTVTGIGGRFRRSHRAAVFGTQLEREGDIDPPGKAFGTSPIKNPRRERAMGRAKAMFGTCPKLCPKPGWPDYHRDIYGTCPKHMWTWMDHHGTWMGQGWDLAVVIVHRSEQPTLEV